MTNGGFFSECPFHDSSKTCSTLLLNRGHGQSKTIFGTILEKLDSQHSNSLQPQSTPTLDLIQSGGSDSLQKLHKLDLESLGLIFGQFVKELAATHQEVHGLIKAVHLLVTKLEKCLTDDDTATNGDDGPDDGSDVDMDDDDLDDDDSDDLDEDFEGFDDGYSRAPSRKRTDFNSLAGQVTFNPFTRKS